MRQNKVAFAEMMLVFITIIWGLGFPITKIAVNSGFGANTIMVGRFLTATILLSAVYHKKFKILDKKIILYGSLTGLFLFFGFFFQTIGNVYTTPSKNGFITQLNIVVVPFLYFLFFKKKVDVYNIFAVIIAIIGMFMLSYNPEGISEINIGDFYTFLCAIMVAFHVVTGSYFQKKYDFDPALFVLVNIVVSMILSLIFMVTTDTLPKVTLFEYWPLLFLGVLNTALGFLVQSYALKVSLPTRISLIVALESVFALAFSILFGLEEFGILVLLGGVLIVLAVVVNETKPLRKKDVLL